MKEPLAFFLFMEIGLRLIEIYDKNNLLLFINITVLLCERRELS